MVDFTVEKIRRIINVNILVIAPHADDEILGCGATMAKYIRNKDNVYVCIVTSPVKPIFDRDRILPIIRSEAANAHKTLGVKATCYCDVPAVMVEEIPRYELNKKLGKVLEEILPDIVYIPHFGDMQKDHQLIAEAMMVVLRPKGVHKVSKVYSYETLSETEWNAPHSRNAFLPNVYNDVTDFIEIKKRAMNCYKSQVSDFPNLRSLETIDALAKYRGATINVRAAEAFMLIREIQ